MHPFQTLWLLFKILFFNLWFYSFSISYALKVQKFLVFTYIATFLYYCSCMRINANKFGAKLEILPISIILRPHCHRTYLTTYSLLTKGKWTEQWRNDNKCPMPTFLSAYKWTTEHSILMQLNIEWRSEWSGEQTSQTSNRYTDCPNVCRMTLMAALLFSRYGLMGSISSTT